MTDAFDPDRYFARIGYTGPRAATLDVLRALHALHPLAIPFENLDPLRGRRVDLALPAIMDKLIDARRGGYCFEQNALFARVLTHLGFQVTPLIGRVVWGQTFDVEAPLTHMVLRVDLDGHPWLVDVGFGAVTLTEPLRLDLADDQQTRLEAFRLQLASADEYHLSVLAGDKWLPMYRFTLRAAESVDYQLGNWYTAAEPTSIFVNHLLACRVLPHGRLSMLDTRYTERGPHGEIVEEGEVKTREALAGILGERFGIDLDGIDLADLLTRLQNAPPLGG